MTDGERVIPEEVAVAFTYNGGAYAVMMATPQDLADFALGFSFTEGIISSPDEICHFETIEEDVGVELRMRRRSASAGVISLDRPVAGSAASKVSRRHCGRPRGCARRKRSRRPTSCARSKGSRPIRR
jgi:formate dehydrogenase accessory protein FdhD